MSYRLIATNYLRRWRKEGRNESKKRTDKSDRNPPIAMYSLQGRYCDVDNEQSARRRNWVVYQRRRRCGFALICCLWVPMVTTSNCATAIATAYHLRRCTPIERVSLIFTLHHPPCNTVSASKEIRKQKKNRCVNMIIYGEEVLLLNVVFSNITVIQSLSPSSP